MKWFACLVLSLGVTSCAGRCIPGEADSCVCSDGRVGAKLCGANGAFERCVCTDSPHVLDGGDAHDAGLEFDAGSESEAAACNENRIGPQLTPQSAAGTLRVSIGAVLDLRDQSTITAEGLGASSLQYVLETGAALPGDGGSALIEGVPAGRHQVDVILTWLCGVKRSRYTVDVVSVRRWPFEITHGVCCDANQRPFVSVTNPSRVLRLEADGGSTEVAQLSRSVRSMALGFDQSLLAIAEDSVLTGFDTTSLMQRFSWPAPMRMPLLWLGGDWAWEFDQAGQTSPERITLASGDVRTTYTPQIFSAIEAVSVDSQTAAICQSAGLAVGVALTDGGLRLGNPGAECCDRIFPTSTPGIILSGCGSLSEVTDGGARTVGQLGVGGEVLEAAPASNGVEGVLTRIRPSVSLVMSRVSLSTFQPLSQAPAGIADPSLADSIEPVFMFVDGNDVAHVFTPAQTPADATWEETFP